MKLHDVMASDVRAIVQVCDVRSDRVGVCEDAAAGKVLVIFETDSGIPDPVVVQRLRALADEIERVVPEARAAGVPAPEAKA